MSTVLITQFSENGTTFDWVHDDGHSGNNVNCGSVSHPDDIDENPIKTLLIVEDSNCGTVSFYPMSGGIMAQKLHKYHLEADTLENVQQDATDRGIDTTDKTQAELITEIIRDECAQKSVLYLI